MSTFLKSLQFNLNNSLNSPDFGTTQTSTPQVPQVQQVPQVLNKPLFVSTSQVSPIEQFIQPSTQVSIGQGSAVPHLTFGQKIKQVLGKAGILQSEEEQQERYNVSRMIAEKTGTDWRIVEKNLSDYTKALGLRTNPTLREATEVLMMLPVTAAFIEAPVSVALGIAGFSALTALEKKLLGGQELSDVISDALGTTEPIKDLANIGEMFAKGGLLYGVYRKAPKLATDFLTNLVKTYRTTNPQAGFVKIPVKTVEAFEKSIDQVPVGSIGGKTFEIGTFGKNALERKVSQTDRLPIAELPRTILNIDSAYKAGPDTSYRKDNIVWISKVGDESRAIVTRQNTKGNEEVINFFKIGRDINEFVKNLESFGTPAGSRTQILSLERSSSNPLNYKGTDSIVSPEIKIKSLSVDNSTRKLTTNFLDYIDKKLASNPEATLSRHEIIDFARRPELKRGEADLLLKKLEEFIPEQYRNKIDLTKGDFDKQLQKVINEKNSRDRIPAQEFADSISRDLLELKSVKVKEPRYKKTTITHPGTSSYEEVVFESPIVTNGSSHYPNSKNYFAHTRGDEVVENGKKIWREQEIQSDALQKEGLDTMAEVPNQMTRRGIDFEATRAANLARQKELEPLQPFTNDRFGERIMRERIKEKAQKGYSKYRLPTGETIGKIEGFYLTEGQGSWIDASNPAKIDELFIQNRINELILKPENLKVGMEVKRYGRELDSWIITNILGEGRFKAVPKQFWDSLKPGQPELGGKPVSNSRVIKRDTNANVLENYKETFDLTGKSNPQYIRYEKWGKWLKNNYDGKVVTDPRGNTWWEIDLKPEYKKASIRAFSIAPLLTAPFLLGTNTQSTPPTKKSVPLFVQNSTNTLTYPQSKELSRISPIRQEIIGNLLKQPNNNPQELNFRNQNRIDIERSVSYNTNEVYDLLAPVLFAEISNRDPKKVRLEFNTIVNTVLNRMQKRGQSMSDVLRDEKQYQGYGSKQFNLYKSGNLDIFSQKKADMINSLINEFISTGLEDSTGGAEYYVHTKDGRIYYSNKYPVKIPNQIKFK